MSTCETENLKTMELSNGRSLEITETPSGACLSFQREGAGKLMVSIVNERVAAFVEYDADLKEVWRFGKNGITLTVEEQRFIADVAERYPELADRLERAMLRDKE